MSILGKFNQIMYQSRFSLFDAIWIIMISGLVASSADGYWWYLMIVPCVAVSVKLERFYRNER